MREGHVLLQANTLHRSPLILHVRQLTCSQQATQTTLRHTRHRINSQGDSAGQLEVKRCELCSVPYIPANNSLPLQPSPSPASCFPLLHTATPARNSDLHIKFTVPSAFLWSYVNNIRFGRLTHSKLGCFWILCSHVFASTSFRE